MEQVKMFGYDPLPRENGGPHLQGCLGQRLTEGRTPHRKGRGQGRRFTKDGMQPASNLWRKSPGMCQV